MKMLLLDALLYEDLLAAIEKEFPNCRQGNVLVPSYGEPNIFDFFKEKTRKTGKGHSKSSIVLKDEDIDLFEFL